MKSSNVLRFKKESVFEEERTEMAKNDDEVFEKLVYMPTLPSTFKSLVGKEINIEREEPQYVIELLGDLLGVTDYTTNKAAFWFLDTVALQVLRYKDKLDDYHRSILISWLTGEMKLIRDNKLLREDFFKQMRILFLRVAKKISTGEQVSHWELLVDEMSEESPRSSDIISSTVESPDTLVDSNAIIQSANAVNPNTVLDIIIDATYNMYANELRYALVYAVFVKQVQIHIFYMPHTLRTPREIKLARLGEKSFDIQLQEQLQKSAVELTTGSRNGKKQKKDEVEKKLAIDDLDTTVIPPTPPTSLIEEEILANNRRFILPLVEAKEAAQILEMDKKNLSR